VELGAPAARVTLEDVRMMQQAVEERGDCGGVAEQFTVQDSAAELRSSVLSQLSAFRKA